MPQIAQKKDRALTPRAFELLLNWLDSGTNSGGRKYLEMRERLVAYFDRKNCSVPDELADETLSRVAGRLEEEGSTDSDAAPAKYCYIMARFVFLEHLRRAQKENALLDNVRRQSESHSFPVPDARDETELKERMLDCLEQCTGKLSAQNRELISKYYTGKERVKIENRRALAEELGITQNALSIRACRIRDKLEVCVQQCVAAR